MGIIVRQSLLNSINNYIGVALGFITTILLFPNIFSPDEYGLTRVLISFSMVYGLVSELGIKQTIVRYFPYFKDPEKDHHGVLFLTLVGSIFGFCLFLILFFLLKPLITSAYIQQSPLFSEYMLFSIPLVFAILFFSNLSNYVKALLDTVFATFISEVLLRISIIVSIFIYYFGWVDFTGFVYLFVGSYIIQPITMLVYIIKIGEFRIKPDFGFLRSRLYKSMIAYSLFSLLTGVTTQLMGNIDVLMLGAIEGLTETAIYTVAYFVGSIIVIPQRAISRIAVPVISASFKRKDYRNIESIYKKSSHNQILAGVFVFIGVVANLDNFYQLLPPEYASSGPIIIAIGLARVFDMATGVNNPIIQVSRYYKFNLLTKITLVILAVITNLIFIPMYGMFGAAIATCITIVCYNSIKLVFVWVKMNMHPFQIKSLPVVLTGAVVLLFSYLIPALDNFIIDIIVRSAFITILFLGIVISFKLSDELMNLFGSLKNRFHNSK